MKKIFTLLSLLTLVIVSCEEPAPEVYSDDDIAYFLDGTSAAFTITSPDDVYSITVGTTNTSSQDRVISIEIDASSSATADQYVISDQLVIPANSHSGTIDISGNIDNVVPGSKLVINLSSVDGTAIAGFQNSFTLDLFLYCPFDRESYLGAYEADDEGTLHEIIITPGSAPNELILSNLWNVTPNSQTRIFITEPSQNEFVVSGTEDYLDNPLILFNVGQGYVGDISGSTNSCTKSIEFDYTVYIPEFQNGYEYPTTVTMTKK